MTYLDYQSAETVDSRAIRLNRIFFRSALACAILPMTTGLAILALYYLFGWDFLTFVGLLMIPIGAFIVLTGIGLAITWCIRQHSVAKRLGVPTRWRTGSLVLLLLLANFPVAFFCFCVGSDLFLGAQVIICISNETGADLTNVKVRTAWPWIRESIPIIMPGCSGNASFNSWHCKSIRIHVEQAGVSKELIFSSPLPNVLQVHVKPGPELDSEIIPHSTYYKIVGMP